MATKIIMPQLGESVIEGTISSWLKQEGDQIEQFEPILEIETDKVTTEATAEVPGTILKILVPAGETVPVGTVLALVGEAGEPVEELDFALPALPNLESGLESTSIGPDQAAAPETPALAANAAPLAAGPYTGRISPVVGRIAAEHGIDLSRIRGTGRHGRITKRDILAFVETRGRGPMAIPTGTARPAPELSPGDLLPLTSIRRAIAEHMVLSKRTSPHVTTIFDIDFTAVAKHRSVHRDPFAQEGARLTFTVYIVSAVAQSLQAHPMVNSTWTDEGVLLRKEINIGMATAIPDGLIVPVIKRADQLSLIQLATAINDLSERARQGRLMPDEVQWGTFTLTNHGVSGSLFATPIINQPQCAILGAGKIEKRVKVIDDAIAIRTMAYASLTFDHRILDGATADGFMSSVKETLENWE